MGYLTLQWNEAALSAIRRNVNTKRIKSAVRVAFPILKRFSVSTATLVVSALSQFLWFVILARSLGLDQFGRLMVVIAVTNIAGALCGVGAGDAMIRRTARNRTHYPLMLGHSLLLLGGTGTVLTVLATGILCFIDSPYGFSFTNLATMAALSFTSIVLFRFVSLVEQIFIGFIDLLRANTVNLGFSLSRLLTTAVACLVFHVDSLGAWAAWTLGGHLLASAACILMLLPFGRPIWGIDRNEVRLGLHYSIPFVVNAVRNNVDRFVLGIVAPSSVLGSYGMALRMAEVSQTVVSALNRIVYPHFAQKKEFGIRGIMPLAIRYLLVVTFLATLTATLVFLAAPFMPLLLGHSYAGVVFDLRVLCWLIVPVAITTVPYDIFGAFDQHSVRAAIYIRVSLLGSLATSVAVYTFGIKGAFVSVFAVQIVLAASMWVTFYSRKSLEMSSEETLARELDENRSLKQDI